MPTLSITKIFTFEAAHALLGYDGLCANIHGHSYRLEVTVCSPALDSVEPGRYIESDKADPKNGMDPLPKGILRPFPAYQRESFVGLRPTLAIGASRKDPFEADAAV